MVQRLQQHLEELKQFNRDRIAWVAISAFVSVSTLCIIADWNFFISRGILWLLVSVGLTITVVWWYWTMVIIRKLIHHKTLESEYLEELIVDIKEMKQEIKSLE